jgi:hypothetical protein
MTVVGPETLVNLGFTTGDQRRPSIHCAPNNEYIICYEDVAITSLICKRYDGSGTAGTPIIVATGAASYPWTCTLADGTWAIIYDASNAVYGKKYTAADAIAVPSFQVNALTSGTIHDQGKIGCLDDDTIVTTWIT